MKVKFAKLNPSGNTTAIIDNRDGQLKRDQYASLAAKLMGTEKLAVEQVGYWEKPIKEGSLGRLQMMGGEFCGNATRCFAKLLCDCQAEGILWEGNQCEIPLEISGDPHVLMVKVEDYCEQSAMVTGSMPKVKKVQQVKCPGVDRPVSGMLFDGILHLIMDGIPFSEKLVADTLQAIYAGRKMEGCDLPDAVGMMFYDQEKNYMKPAVYVKEVDSLVYEGSCGSGSIAVAAYKFHTSGENVHRMLLEQPGGKLYASYEMVNEELTAKLSGPVVVECMGEVWI